MRKRRRAGVGAVMSGFGPCSSGKPIGNFLCRTKGEHLRSTKVSILVFPALIGQGGTITAEDLLLPDPIVSRLKETDSKLDKLETIDGVRRTSDIDPRDEVGVMVAEFRIVSETEDPYELQEHLVITESPEELDIESRVPGDAEKKDDKDELDMLLKRAVYGIAVGWK